MLISNRREPELDLESEENSSTHYIPSHLRLANATQLLDVALLPAPLVGLSHGRPE